MGAAGTPGNEGVWHARAADTMGMGATHSVLCISANMYMQLLGLREQGILYGCRV